MTAIGQPPDRLNTVSFSPNPADGSNQSRTVTVTFDILTAWVESQPAGPDADHLRSTASVVLGENSPAEALALAGKISAPATRTDTTVTIFKRWRETEPAAAAQWLAGQKLPPDLGARLQ